MRKTGKAFGRRRARAEIGLVLGLVGLAAIPVSVIPAVAQQSNADFRNMTVLQRPRDQYDPKGIALGTGFRMYPGLEVAETYTDNLYATDAGTIDDFETVISPSVAITSNWSRHRLTVTGFASIHRYLDTDTENHENYAGNAALDLNLAEGGRLAISGGYSHESVDRGDPEEAGRVEPEEVNTTLAKLVWSRRFSRLLVGLRGEYRIFEYVSALDRDQDRNEYTGAVRVGYVFSPALSVFAEPYYTLRDFDLATDFSGDFNQNGVVEPGLGELPGVNRDSELMGVDAGVSYDITGVLYGETKVGWYRADFDAPGFESDTGISIESDTTWNFTPRDSLIVTVLRRNVITNDPFSSSRVLTGGQVEYQHELRRNIVLQGKVGYFIDDYVEAEREERRIEGMVRGDYYLNPNVSLYLSYARASVDSTIAFDDYDENRITLGIRGQI